MARKRRDNTTAAAIKVGDLIEPDNNGFRATVTRKEDDPNPNITEPHVALHWAYPADDFSVNANFRGTTSGRYFRPGDPITRWLDSGRTADSLAEAKGKKTAIPVGIAGVDYRQAVTQLIAAADQVAEYRADLAAFADNLGGKKWGAKVTGPIQDMDGELIALEGEYRDLAAQMKSQGDQGAAVHEQAPWVPADESILA